MSWILIAIIAHLLAGLVHIVDKLILSKTAFLPYSYAFFIGLLGVWSLVLAPFGMTFLPLGYLVIALGAGMAFTSANVLFYKSIKSSQVSVVAPIIGGAVPCWSLILTYVFLAGDRLTGMQLLAFALLVIGSVIMLWKKDVFSRSNDFFKKIIIALLSAFFFSTSFVLSKYLYYRYSFINIFIWIRMGALIGALLLLLIPKAYREIRKTGKAVGKKVQMAGFPLLNKILSAIAFILLNYAIYLGNVALVNALQGVQYAFILITAILISKWFSKSLNEDLEFKFIFRKVIAIIFIGIGLFVLAI